MDRNTSTKFLQQNEIKILILRKSTVHSVLFFNMKEFLLHILKLVLMFVLYFQISLHQSFNQYICCLYILFKRIVDMIDLVWMNMIIERLDFNQNTSFERFNFSSRWYYVAHSMSEVFCIEVQTLSFINYWKKYIFLVSFTISQRESEYIKNFVVELKAMIETLYMNSISRRLNMWNHQMDKLLEFVLHDLITYLHHIIWFKLCMFKHHCIVFNFFNFNFNHQDFDCWKNNTKVCLRLVFVRMTPWLN